MIDEACIARESPTNSFFNVDGIPLTMEDYGKVEDVKELLVTEKTSAHRKDLILMYLNWVSIK